jgi:hypothetical protein
MPDSKISALTDGVTFAATDRIPVARSPFAPTDNRFITAAYIAATLLGATVGLTGATVTDPTPLINQTQTWNDAADTMIGWRLNITDTASAVASLLLDLQVGGSSIVKITKAGGISVLGVPEIKIGAGTSTYIIAAQLLVADTGIIGFSGTSSAASGADAMLRRDAPNVLAQRNSTNAQTFRIYNTFTDAANYERLILNWSTNTVYLVTDQAGTGSPRAMSIGTSGANSLDFQTSNSVRFRLNSSGHLLAVTDNTYDIGAAGATRPRNLYVGTSAIIGSSLISSTGIRAPATGYHFWEGRATMTSPADGVIRLTDTAETSFGRLQFGGTTASFPALKRNGAAIDVRLADDSAFAMLAAEYLSITDGITAPGAVAGRARLYVDIADGDLKVIFGDGVIKTITTDV